MNVETASTCQRLWVVLEDFEGELERLVALVRTERAMLWRISLVNLIRQLEANVEGIDDIVVAVELSTILIKMKSELLAFASKNPDVDDETAAQEQQAAAAAKLVEYQELVRRIREREDLEVFGRKVDDGPGEVRPFPKRSDGSLSLEELEAELLTLAEQPVTAPLIVPVEEISVAGAAEELLAEVLALGRISLGVFGDRPLRFRIAVFLALMELVRERALRAEQEAAFAEIWVEAREGRGE